MKKRFIALSVILVIIGIAVWFFVFRDANRYTCRQAVPDDAVFIFETPSFSNIYENLYQSNIWKFLKQYPYFSEYRANIEYADSLGTAYPSLRKLVLNRPFSVSCHLLPDGQSDFLYVCDLGKMNIIATFEKALAALLKDYNVKTDHLQYQDCTISVTNCDGTVFYYTIKGNLLIASMTKDLVRNAINTSKTKEKTGKYEGNANISINHKQLQKMLDKIFIPGESGNGYPLLYTDLIFNLNKDNLNLAGDTRQDTTQVSLLSALNQVGGTASKVKNIIGSNTAAYCSFCFTSFAEVQEILQDSYRTKNPQAYREYEEMMRKMNKFLGISVKEQLTSWIGNEITLIRPELKSDTPLETVVIAIQSKDIEYAREQLSLLTEQINRKTPVRFKEITYNGHTISYISMKGFFKLFFGKMFDKLERPYYTFLGDYVVFSNSPACLTNMIKDYVLGHTLANDEKHNTLMDQLGSSSNIYAYANMPNLYNYLYQTMKSPSREELSKNKNAALSFETIGMELENKKGIFNTRIITTHNTQAPEEYILKEFNNKLEQLADDIESGMYYPTIPDSIAVSTRTEYSYENAGHIFKGTLKDGEPDGYWNILNEQGGVIGRIPYKNGKANGDALFLYGSGKTMAKIIYSDGLIKTYQEFFEDGTPKAELEYSRGTRNGDAKFYYTTGHLLCEGKYKKGQRKGTWHYYRVTGETDKKVKF